MRDKGVALFAGLFAIATAWPAAQAEDPPANPDQVLSAAGLVLKETFCVYVLRAEAEAEAETIRRDIDKMRVRLDETIFKYQALFEIYLVGKKAVAQLFYSESLTFDKSTARKQAGESEPAWNQAMALERPMAADQMEIWREEARYRSLVDSIPRQYTTLAADPRIKAALRALNKGRQPKLALGPAAAYEKNVFKQSKELLDLLGFHQDGDVYWLAEEAQLIRQVGVAYPLWREIAGEEPRLAPPVPAAPAPATVRPAAPVTRGAQAATAHARKPLTAAELAAKRALFVRLVRTLRPQADALQKRREGLLAEGEARDALDEINRTNSKTHQAHLGPHPGLKRVLEDLEAMERAVPTVEIVLARDGVPLTENPRAAQDISKLSRYGVLRVPDGNTIQVKKPGEAPELVRLLGVASPPGPIDFAPLRRKKLGDLINDREVALAAEPERAPGKRQMAAWVYRVPDGLLVNLAIVKAGYGVTADDAPASLKSTLLAAELEAMAEHRGLWSPTARDEVAALVVNVPKPSEPPKKQKTEAGKNKPTQGQPFPDRIAVMDEQAKTQYIRTWLMNQRQVVFQRQSVIEESERLQRAARDQAKRALYSPEIDAGPAAGAFALLVCGVLMLASRRRTRWA